MGIFSDTKASSDNSAYEKSIKPLLQEKNGNTYVLMISSFSKIATNVFMGEKKYTTEINMVITNMQEMGYEILDIKTNITTDQTLMGRENFFTLITYK